jgi:DNA-binding NtrC family response regulator
MDCNNLRILIVNEETNSCDLLPELKSRGCNCEIAMGAKGALARLKEDQFDIIILEDNLPKGAIELIKTIKIFYLNLAIAVITTVNDLNVAVDLMKAGALDYITKPFDLNRLEGALSFVLGKLSQTAYSRTCFPDKKIAGIEAIALGVEARQEILDVHTDNIIFQTVGIARKMGFTEENIQKWVYAKSETRALKNRIVIDSIRQVARFKF